jgi:hypothetical protein
MFRKSLAVFISGILVLGSSSAVFAADAATSDKTEATGTESTSDDSLTALIGGFLGEDGDSIDLEGLLGAVTDENGELNLDGIVGSLSEGEEGSLDLNGIVSGLLGGEEGSLDLGGIVSGLFGGEEGSFDLSGILGSVLGEENAENALDIQALLGSLVGEDGSFDLNGIIGGLLGGEEGEFNVEELLGYVVDENGNLDLSGVLGMFGMDEESLDLGGILDSIGEMGGESFSKELKNLEAEAGIADAGEEVSLDQVEAMVTELASNPEEVTSLIGSLFKEGGIGAALLDMVGSTDETFAGIVDNMKDDSGEYSLDRMAEALDSIEVNDEGVSIDGQEISQEEIEKSVNQLLEAFGLSEEALEAAQSEAA